MHLIKPIIAAGLLALGGIVHAETAKSIHLAIDFIDGGSALINVQDNVDPNNLPSMKIGPSMVTVTVPQLGKETNTYTYEAIGIYTFSFHEFETSSIGQLVDESKAIITAMGGGVIRVNTSAAVDVKVYDINGRQVNVEKSIDGDATVISLAGLGTGVYIVSYKDATLKITKK